MLRVLEHIDQHLDEDLDLETVSAVAAFSKFHFHRQFTATFEMSLHRYVQLARLKRASHRLSAGDHPDVTTVALDAGYEAPAAFARAFRQRLGQSPTSFRQSPDWGSWLSAFGPLDNARSKLMQQTFSTEDITIREVSPTPVALMEHRGPRTSIPDTAKRFHAWRKANGVSPLTSTSFTVFRSEREPEEAGNYAMDLCVETDQPIAKDDDEVRASTIPGGRCAVMRVDGTSNNHLPAALYMYREWLPASGEEPRDFPMYCQRRLIVAQEGAQQEVFAELFLPLK
jgi:AraC family transcriptional regulator